MCLLFIHHLRWVWYTCVSATIHMPANANRWTSRLSRRKYLITTNTTMNKTQYAKCVRRKNKFSTFSVFGACTMCNVFRAIKLQFKPYVAMTTNYDKQLRDVLYIVNTAHLLSLRVSIHIERFPNTCVASITLFAVQNNAIIGIWRSPNTQVNVCILIFHVEQNNDIFGSFFRRSRK